MLGAAAVALAFAATPAKAQDDSGVKLNIGGAFKGYVNYSNYGPDRTIDVLRHTEVHFGGETTLDNGLTVGAHIETYADTGDSFDIDESYVYFAGSWGRVNFGDEDGAAYLLQVAAPSADSNVDGIRQYINPVSFLQNLKGRTNASGATGTTNGSLDYANDITRHTDKFTYLSPIFSGFQAGISYSPEVVNSHRATNGNWAFPSTGSMDDVVEMAVRYEGMISNVGVILGGAYTFANNNVDQWNVGADLDIGAFGLGAVYTTLDRGSFDTSTDNIDTWVVGADYTTGPFKLGLSYLNEQQSAIEDVDRWTGGVVYTYGPGMTFRGSLGYTQDDAQANNPDATTVTVGTQINF